MKTNSRNTSVTNILENSGIRGLIQVIQRYSYANMTGVYAFRNVPAHPKISIRYMPVMECDQAVCDAIDNWLNEHEVHALTLRVRAGRMRNESISIQRELSRGQPVLIVEFPDGSNSSHIRATFYPTKL